MAQLTQIQHAVIRDLDRLIAYFQAANRPLAQIHINKKQEKILAALAIKARTETIYTDAGQLYVHDHSYRGIPLIPSTTPRRKRRKTDTGALLKDTAE